MQKEGEPAGSKLPQAQILKCGGAFLKKECLSSPTHPCVALVTVFYPVLPTSKHKHHSWQARS